jgi:hypothetical protein
MEIKNFSINQQIGIISTGIVVMAIIIFFLPRLQLYTLEGLGALVTIIFGGVVVKFITDRSDKGYAWNYPIGLLLGIVLFKTGLLNWNFLSNSVIPNSSGSEAPLSSSGITGSASSGIIPDAIISALVILIVGIIIAALINRTKVKE